MRITKYILLLLILFSLIISPVQQHFPFCREEPLHGFFTESKLPELKYFTWARWFSSIFQNDFSTGTDNNVGFRKSLIRISNQLDYSIFGITHAKNFISGKNGYLFEEDYIHEYNGDYFIGTPALDKKLQRLKNVMDSLAAHKVPLLLVFEPGKASFYPEHIPNRFHPEEKRQNNYNYLVKRATELGLPFMDLNRYFLQIKDTSRYPLFPKYGMHWSMYGTQVVADTLSRLVAKSSGKPMPEFKVQKIHHSGNSLGSDFDIGELLNLLFPLPAAPAAYPMVSFHSIPPGIPSALVIGDSYYITLIETYGAKMFGKQDFWYYNKKIYPYQNDIPPVLVDKSDLREKLKKYDVIMLMVSEINLHSGFWDFADEAYLAFHPEARDPHVYRIENQIRNEREWFQFVAAHAKLEQSTLEKSIRVNAEYTFSVYYNDLPNKGYWDTILYITMNIRNNKEWMTQITKNAHDEQMDVDTALKLNAIYSYDQSKKKQ